MVRWLGGDVRTVLDVGAGAGFWRAYLAENEPAVRYMSIDASPYACERYGHLHRDIARWRDTERYDLVVCQGVLPYLDDDGARRAIANIGAMCAGFLYLEAITTRDIREVCDLDKTDVARSTSATGDFYLRALGEHFVRVGAGLFYSRRGPLRFYELEAISMIAPFDENAARPVPALAEQDGATLVRLVGVMRRLLAPNGCPWDREQSLESLRKYVLEEACEVIDAIDSGNRDGAPRGARRFAFAGRLSGGALARGRALRDRRRRSRASSRSSSRDTRTCSATWKADTADEVLTQLGEDQSEGEEGARDPRRRAAQPARARARAAHRREGRRASDSTGQTRADRSRRCTKRSPSSRRRSQSGDAEQKKKSSATRSSRS